MRLERSTEAATVPHKQLQGSMVCAAERLGLDTSAGDLEEMLGRYRQHRARLQELRRARREEEGLPTRDQRMVLMAEENSESLEEGLWGEIFSANGSKQNFE